MSVRCPYCGRDYDATLFEFGRSITCDCGRNIVFKHEISTESRNFPPKKKRLLFIGDSLVEYYDWAGRLEGYDVHNLGVAGETVGGLARRLNSVFNKIKTPDIVFIMSGINNIAMGDTEFLYDYHEAVREIKGAYPGAKIVLQSLLPVLFESISNDDIRYVNAMIQRIAFEEDLIYLDLRRLFLDEREKPKRSLLLDDGVHLSPEGYAVWSDALEKLLGQL